MKKKTLIPLTIIWMISWIVVILANIQFMWQLISMWFICEVVIFFMFRRNLR